MGEAIAEYFVENRNRLPSNAYDFSKGFLQHLTDDIRETVVDGLMHAYAHDGKIFCITDMTRVLGLNPDREILLTALGKAIEKGDVTTAFNAMDVMREEYGMEIPKKYKIAYNHISSLERTGDIKITHPEQYVKQLLSL